MPIHRDRTEPKMTFDSAWVVVAVVVVVIAIHYF
jgi:hypothetical protein